MPASGWPFATAGESCSSRSGRRRLGNLTIRVTSVEGALQAQIIADRPEAARLLAQALPSLSQALSDMGLGVQDLDVALGGDGAFAGAGDADGGDAARTRADELGPGRAADGAADTNPDLDPASGVDILA